MAGDWCYKCREMFKDMRESETFKDNPLLVKYLEIIGHCHHEPKEKPVCMCHDSSYSLPSYPEMNFCPECGRNLRVKGYDSTLYRIRPHDSTILSKLDLKLT